jgi:hypothetical protein
MCPFFAEFEKVLGDYLLGSYHVVKIFSFFILNIILNSWFCQKHLGSSRTTLDDMMINNWQLAATTRYAQISCRWTPEHRFTTIDVRSLENLTIIVCIVPRVLLYTIQSTPGLSFHRHPLCDMWGMLLDGPCKSTNFSYRTRRDTVVCVDEYSDTRITHTKLERGEEREEAIC